MAIFDFTSVAPGIQEAAQTAPPCPSNQPNTGAGPFFCGPPKVEFFGGGGEGALVNTIISPNSSSVIGFDIINPGIGFLTEPFANLVDSCGKGQGAALKVNLLDDGTGRIKNIEILSTGDNYLPAPDGSMGGEGATYIERDESYFIDENGNYSPPIRPNTTIAIIPDYRVYVPAGTTMPIFDGDGNITFTVPGGTLTVVPEGGTATTPVPPTITTAPVPEIEVGGQVITPSPLLVSDRGYDVFLEIDEVVVTDPGFGYQLTDTIFLEPDNGAVLEPVINADGELSEVKVIEPGIGFVDFPTIYIKSDTGYNATMRPIFRARRLEDFALDELPDPGTKVVTIIDCVGKHG